MKFNFNLILQPSLALLVGCTPTPRVDNPQLREAPRVEFTVFRGDEAGTQTALYDLGVLRANATTGEGALTYNNQTNPNGLTLQGRNNCSNGSTVTAKGVGLTFEVGGSDKEPKVDSNGFVSVVVPKGLSLKVDAGAGLFEFRQECNGKK